jgi:hypothetical protein
MILHPPPRHPSPVHLAAFVLAAGGKLKEKPDKAPRLRPKSRRYGTRPRPEEPSPKLNLNTLNTENDHD